MKLRGLMAAALAAGLATSALAFAVEAQATTYVGIEEFDGATVDLTISTDGKLGALNQNDILSWNIVIGDSGGTNVLTPSDSIVDFYNTTQGDITADGSLSATSTNLSFNFISETAGVGFLGDSGIDGKDVAFCLQDNSCFDNNGPEIGLNTDGDFSPATMLESGEVVIATASGVSAAPEPSTWALMIAGIGGVGLALRRAQRSVDLRVKPAAAA